ncbi:MAG: cation transporter [Candidatus Krumholzibacteriota bacterium]|nr:cation transporter [Candidatus Krumholzibacteriota bacterium]
MSSHSGHAHHSHGIESGRKITWASIWINAFLIVLKILGGIFGQSRALLADGIHSVSDFISDIVVLIGLHFLAKESDEDHPYGHGKIESVATLFVGVTLLLAAFRIGIDASMAIYRGEIAIPHGYTIIIAALSVAFKEILYHLTVRIGRTARSEAMIANAWHHRSDAISSVITLVGITVAIYNPSLRVLDSYAALLVSFFIIKVSFGILKSAFKKIIDTSPSKEFLDRVRGLTADIDGVRECHDLMARYYADRIRMEIHIQVDPLMTVADSHRIVDAVVERITEEYPEVEKVLVHVDPYEERKD